jgi:hypothetical protein
MSFVLTKTEDMIAHFLASSSLSASAINIYRGLGNEDKTAPALIIVAESGTEEFPNSGVWHVKTGLMVKELAADSNITSSLASSVYEVFLNNTTTKQALSGSGYYCYDLFVEDTANSIEGDTWVQTLRMDIVCALT